MAANNIVKNVTRDIIKDLEQETSSAVYMLVGSIYSSIQGNTSTSLLSTHINCSYNIAVIEDRSM
jgi:hypothetical protein